MKLLLGLSIFLGVLTSAQESFAQQRFLMGYSSFSANQTPIWIAKEEGLFKRFGTEPDLILIEGGTRGAQALISGDLPIMGMSGQPVISARARGSDLTMIAGTVNKMNYVLVGAPSVKKPEDLKGKRIGAAQAGTASYHGVLLGLSTGALTHGAIGSPYCNWAIRERGSPRCNRAAATRSSSIPVSDRH
jgi:ABC-type nitrate/sulfonate/bicarbonate transport system substrate-binding protein